MARDRDPQRALRQAAGDLARLHPDDATAILAALGPEERARFERAVAGEPEPEAEPETWSYEGVSPWLLERIDPDAKPRRRGGPFILMTGAATAALRAAAEPFKTRTSTPGRRRGASLFGRLFDALAGRRG